MTSREDVETIERRMRELGEELGRLKADDVDVDVVEGRVLEMAKAWGRAQMAIAMKRADATAPEVEINGERWGNRRETPHDYETLFGMVPLERAVYQQSGRGRVAVPMDLRLGMVEGTYTPRCVFRSTWARVPAALDRAFRLTWAPIGAKRRVPSRRSEATHG